MHQTSNEGQCCQQPNYRDLAIKTALTTKALIQDPTGQIQELGVKDQLLKL